MDQRPIGQIISELIIFLIALAVVVYALKAFGQVAEEPFVPPSPDENASTTQPIDLAPILYTKNRVEQLTTEYYALAARCR